MCLIISVSLSVSYDVCFIMSVLCLFYVCFISCPLSLAHYLLPVINPSPLGRGLRGRAFGEGIKGKGLNYATI